MSQETRTFEVNGEIYEIRYNLSRVEMYEKRNPPIMQSLSAGAFRTSELIGLVAYGLKKEGGGYVSPNQGMEMARNLLEQNGYVSLLVAVSDALERDCGFLFMTTNGN